MCQLLELNSTRFKTEWTLKLVDDKTTERIIKWTILSNSCKFFSLKHNFFGSFVQFNKLQKYVWKRVFHRVTRTLRNRSLMGKKRTAHILYVYEKRLHIKYVCKNLTWMWEHTYTVGGAQLINVCLKIISYWASLLLLVLLLMFFQCCFVVYVPIICCRFLHSIFENMFFCVLCCIFSRHKYLLMFETTLKENLSVFRFRIITILLS